MATAYRLSLPDIETMELMLKDPNGCAIDHTPKKRKVSQINKEEINLTSNRRISDTHQNKAKVNYGIYNASMSMSSGSKYFRRPPLKPPKDREYERVKKAALMKVIACEEPKMYPRRRSPQKRYRIPRPVTNIETGTSEFWWSEREKKKETLKNSDGKHEKCGSRPPLPCSDRKQSVRMDKNCALPNIKNRTNMNPTKVSNTKNTSNHLSNPATNVGCISGIRSKVQFDTYNKVRTFGKTNKTGCANMSAPASNRNVHVTLKPIGHIKSRPHSEAKKVERNKEVDAVYKENQGHMSDNCTFPVCQSAPCFSWSPVGHMISNTSLKSPNTDKSTTLTLTSDTHDAEAISLSTNSVSRRGPNFNTIYTDHLTNSSKLSMDPLNNTSMDTLKNSSEQSMSIDSLNISLNDNIFINGSSKDNMKNPQNDDMSMDCVNNYLERTMTMDFSNISQNDNMSMDALNSYLKNTISMESLTISSKDNISMDPSVNSSKSSMSCELSGVTAPANSPRICMQEILVDSHSQSDFETQQTTKPVPKVSETQQATIPASKISVVNIGFSESLFDGPSLTFPSSRKVNSMADSSNFSEFGHMPRRNKLQRRVIGQRGPMAVRGERIGKKTHDRTSQENRLFGGGEQGEPVFQSNSNDYYEDSSLNEYEKEFLRSRYRGDHENGSIGGLDLVRNRCFGNIPTPVESINKGSRSSNTMPLSTQWSPRRLGQDTRDLQTLSTERSGRDSRNQQTLSKPTKRTGKKGKNPRLTQELKFKNPKPRAAPDKIFRGANILKKSIMHRARSARYINAEQSEAMQGRKAPEL